MLIFLHLLGSVALLLWGLRMVRTGVMRAYGTSLRRLAGRAEGKKAPAFLAGIIIALLLQSSTATALISASFAGQGVISTGAAFVTILGADIGTAIAVVVASQKIALISPLLLAIGIFGHLSTENRKRRSLFRALTGLGLILLALGMIGETATKLAQFDEFATVVRIFAEQPFFLVLFAVVLTYAAHSSLAIVLLTTGFVASGFLDLQSGLYLVLGANIGSGLLPVIANLKAKPQARAPVTANLLIRTLGVLAVYPFIGLIVENYAAYLLEAMFPPAFHLSLNVMVALAGLILASPLLRISQWILPAASAGEDIVEPKYLDEDAFDSPATALTCAKREALNMADVVQVMVVNALPVLQENDEQLRRRVVDMDDTADLLFNAIKHYLARIMQEELTEEDSARALDLLAFIANMEHIGDIVDGSLMDIAAKKINAQIQFSDEGLSEITTLHEVVSANFDLAINTFVSGDSELAHDLYAAKKEVQKIERKSVSTHLKRIGDGLPDTIGTSSLHMDVLRDLKRINSHLTSVAYPVLKAAGEVPKTKWKRKDRRTFSPEANSPEAKPVR